MIKQLLNSVIAKYRDLSVSRRSIICLSLRLRQIIDLLATDKSRYFAQPRPIIANYLDVLWAFSRFAQIQHQWLWKHTDNVRVTNGTGFMILQERSTPFLKGQVHGSAHAHLSR